MYRLPPYIDLSSSSYAQQSLAPSSYSLPHEIQKTIENQLNLSDQQAFFEALIAMQNNTWIEPLALKLHLLQRIVPQEYREHLARSFINLNTFALHQLNLLCDANYDDQAVTKAALFKLLFLAYSPEIFGFLRKQVQQEPALRQKLINSIEHVKKEEAQSFRKIRMIEAVLFDEPVEHTQWNRNPESETSTGNWEAALSQIPGIQANSAYPAETHLISHFAQALQFSSKEDNQNIEMNLESGPEHHRSALSTHAPERAEENESISAELLKSGRDQSLRWTQEHQDLCNAVTKNPSHLERPKQYEEFIEQCDKQGLRRMSFTSFRKKILPVHRKNQVLQTKQCQNILEAVLKAHPKLTRLDQHKIFSAQCEEKGLPPFSFNVFKSKIPDWDRIQRMRWTKDHQGLLEAVSQVYSDRTKTDQHKIFDSACTAQNLRRFSLSDFKKHTPSEDEIRRGSV